VSASLPLFGAFLGYVKSFVILGSCSGSCAPVVGLVAPRCLTVVGWVSLFSFLGLLPGLFPD
jgi:hypothetical protein